MKKEAALVVVKKRLQEGGEERSFLGIVKKRLQKKVVKEEAPLLK